MAKKSPSEQLLTTASNTVQIAPGQEILEPDALATAANQIENLSQSEAVYTAKQLIEENSFNAFKLGGVLAVIQDNEWYEGYASFKGYVENEIEFSPRKAAYCISIYKGLLEAGVTWEQVKILGWTKVAKLIPVLTQENAPDWVEKAAKLSVLQIEEEVKKAKSHVSEQGTESDQKQVTTRSFKMHADQREVVEAALESAKSLMSDTATDASALQNICLDFMGSSGGAVSQTGGSTDEKPQTEMSQVPATPDPETALKAALKQYRDKYPEPDEALDAIFESFDNVFPDVEIDVTIKPGGAV